MGDHGCRRQRHEQLRSRWRTHETKPTVRPAASLGRAERDFGGILNVDVVVRVAGLRRLEAEAGAVNGAMRQRYRFIFP
jgi:hypothetical protein